MTAELTALTEKEGKHKGENKELVCRQVEELKLATSALLAENDLFDRFLGRLDPRDLLSSTDGDHPGFQSKAEGGGWRRRSRPNASEHLQLLTLEQKVFVAQREVAETRKDKKQQEQKNVRIQDGSKAALKEVELRVTEIRKAKSVFDRKLVKPVKEHKLEIKEPTVLRYVTEKFKVNQSDQFKLKNQALKAREQKLLQQLQHRKQTGRAKYEEVCLDDSEDGIRNHQDELQTNNVKLQRKLSAQKIKLQNVTSQSAELSSDITRMKHMLDKLEEELKRAEEDCFKSKVLKQHLQQQLGDYEAPDVMEHLHVRNQHQQLQQSILTRQRRVRIAELALKLHSKAGNKPAAAPTPEHSVQRRNDV